MSSYPYSPLHFKVPHGKGSIEYFDMHLQDENVKNYTGDWKFGKKSGYGRMFWWSGDR